MLIRTRRERSGSIRSWIGLSVLLALAAGPLSAVEIEGQEVALNCNSDIAISESVDAVDNTLFHVVVTVSNVESSDVFDVPQTQQFPVVTFFPSCSSTVPCVPATGVDFVMGSGSSNCPQALNPAAVGPNSVDFTFTPTLELGPNAAPGMGFDTSCNVFFDVRVNPVPVAATTFNVEATTSGVCQNFGVPGSFTSDTTGTDDIMFVPAMPTMGEVALAVLAILLLAGALVILRRRQLSSTVAP